MGATAGTNVSIQISRAATLDDGSPDILHEEIDQPRIALENLENLQSPIACFDLRKLDYGRGLYFGEAIGRGDVFRQNAGEEQREETAERSRDSRQIVTSK